MPRIGAYQESLAQGRLPAQRGVALSLEDRLRAAIIERLMCDLAVDLDSVAVLHGMPDFDFARERDALKPLAAEGIVCVAGSRITVPEAMRPIVRVVAAVFDASRVAIATHAPVV